MSRWSDHRVQAMVARWVEAENKWDRESEVTHGDFQITVEDAEKYSPPDEPRYMELDYDETLIVVPVSAGDEGGIRTLIALFNGYRGMRWMVLQFDTTGDFIYRKEE